jgi:asparagine synthase (glutamine-hydrolysing)
LVRHYGEPFGDSSAIPTYFVSRLARRHVKMVLTGDGGDEAFLGYGRYFGWHNWVNPGSSPRAVWKRLVRPGLHALMPQRFSTRRSVGPHDWLPWIEAINAQVRKVIWRSEFVHLVNEPIDEIEEVMQDARALCPEQFGQYFDYRTYLPQDILTKVDVASMIHGLECRTPLADVCVAEFAGKIPWTMNLRKNGSGEWTGKHLLKRIVGKYFSPEFIERKKTGFGVPLNHWFAQSGALRQELSDRLSLGNARIYCYFQPEAVRRLVKEHDVHERDNSQALWQLLFLENWLEHTSASKHQGVCEMKNFADVGP